MAMVCLHAFLQSCKSLTREHFLLHLERFKCGRGSEICHALTLKDEGTPCHGGQVATRCWIWQSPQKDQQPS